jgi:hypothetical protein
MTAPGGEAAQDRTRRNPSMVAEATDRARRGEGSEPRRTGRFEREREPVATR